MRKNKKFKHSEYNQVNKFKAKTSQKYQFKSKRCQIQERNQFFQMRKELEVTIKIEMIRI